MLAGETRRGEVEEKVREGGGAKYEVRKRKYGTGSVVLFSKEYKLG